MNLTEKTTFPTLVFHIGKKGFFRTQTQTLTIIPPKHLVFQMVDSHFRTNGNMQSSVLEGKSDNNTNQPLNKAEA